MPAPNSPLCDLSLAALIRSEPSLDLNPLPQQQHLPQARSMQTQSTHTKAATTATSANTASAIVARDASGNFTANNISAVGDVTVFASDIRLKTNIKPIDNAISKVLSLNGFTYSFNEIGESLGFDAGVRHSGVSAQDVQEVLPEAVCPAPVSEDYLTVKYEKIVPLLIEAIKEQQEQINILIAATRQQ